MDFSRERFYLDRILSNMRIRSACLPASDFVKFDHDFGLRVLLGISSDYRSIIEKNLHLVKSKKIYLFDDQFRLTYLLMRMPLKAETYFFIGPFSREEISEKMILEIAESVSLPADKLSRLKNFYLSIPAIGEASNLFSVITAFGEIIWGSASEFEYVNLTWESVHLPPPSYPDLPSDEENDLSVRMQHMELRYQYENELMRLVSKGLYHRAASMLSQFSEATVDQRLPDALRNLKNYAIISSTLLRKAAESGGVHPFELDRISSDYALMIENAVSIQKVKACVNQMLLAYCRAVRKQCIRSYSLPIQKAILYIESHLSSEITLTMLSVTLKLNSCYLSDLFHKETGQTLTQFITEKRMDLAAKLLNDVPASIQSVAQKCGIPDVNYFSKLFKKAYGVSPRKFKANADLITRDKKLL